MAQTAKNISISREERYRLSTELKEFCTTSKKQKNTEISKILQQQLLDFYKSNNENRQALGVWVCNFLLELVPHLRDIKPAETNKHYDLFYLLQNLPYDMKSERYQQVLNSISAQDIAPLTTHKYLLLLETCQLLIELEADNLSPYLDELSSIEADKSSFTLLLFMVEMIKAKTHQVKGQYPEEQLCWLNLALNALHQVDVDTAVTFLVQWAVSLKWIRPSQPRKEVLLVLNDTVKLTDQLNKAIVTFELFNFPDKSVATGEKLNYLNKLKNLPAELLSVEQLQNMYYFSGSIKSSIESSFMESVSDFQQSNYYTYKYWNRIREINQFFIKQLTPSEYLSVLPKIESKKGALINLINIQSNAYVETLQSNFNKIEELYRQVEEMSLRDTLTCLYNRRYLYNNINELLLLAVRQQTPLSFVMIDIDDFKPINDTYGHLAGDFILVQMAEMLKNYFRKSDIIIRYGGEEFLIVMFNTDHDRSRQTLEIFRTNVMSHAHHYQNLELQITISIGIASCLFVNQIASVNLEKLILEADNALYESKTSGKNKITSKEIVF